MWHASGTAGEDERGSDLAASGTSSRCSAGSSSATTFLVGKSPEARGSGTPEASPADAMLVDVS